MKRNYDYATRLTPALLRGYKAEVYRTKLILRKLVRESLLCTARPKADGKHYEVHEAWANRIARRMVP